MEKPLSLSVIYAHGLMLIITFLAASSFPVSAEITKNFDSTITTFLRFALATTFILPYALLKHNFTVLTLKQFLRYVLLSIPLVIFFWTMFESLRYTSAVNTSALFTLIPAITALFALILNREKTGRLRTIGLLIGVLGSLWIVFGGNLRQMLSLEFSKGDLIFLGGCFFLALYGPLFKLVYRNEPLEVMTFWILLISSVVLFVIFGRGLWSVEWRVLRQTQYLALLYLGLIYAISFIVRQYTILQLGATKVSAYSFLVPVFVLLITVVIDVDKLKLALLPGIALIVTSMLIVQHQSNEFLASPSVQLEATNLSD